MSKRAFGILAVFAGALGIAISVFGMQWVTMWHSFPRADGPPFSEVHPLRWRAIIGGLLTSVLLVGAGFALINDVRIRPESEPNRESEDQ